MSFIDLPGPFTDATTVCVTTFGDGVNVTVLVSVTVSVTVCVTVGGGGGVSDCGGYCIRGGCM